MTSSVFPGALDSFVDPNPTSKCNATNTTGPVALHSALHALENDAIAALQAKVGIDSSTDHNSLDYKVAIALEAILALQGTSLLYGSGAPTSGIGVDGNFYLDDAAQTLYGPKASGSWPAGVSLVGADGSPGPANSLAIGTVTTGAAGSSAIATITGTSPSQTLNLTIPRGDTGAAGTGGGNSGPHNVPLSTSFTVVGTPTPTLSDNVGRMVVTIPSASGHPRLLLRSVPAAPYTIDIGGFIVGLNPPSSDAYALSIGLYDGTKVYSYSIAYFGQSQIYPKFSCDKWNTTSSYNATSFSIATAISQQHIYLRLTDDGTKRKFYYSMNGLDYYLIYTEATNTWLIPTQVGIEIYNNSASSVNAIAIIDHFMISNSILGNAA